MRTFEEKVLGERMGNARRKGNDVAFTRSLDALNRLVKIMSKFELSHIDSKALDQAKQIVRIDKAVSDIDDAMYKLKQIDKRGK